MANKSKDVKFNPAGKNDDFEITVMDINSIIEKGKDVLKAINGKRISAVDLSINLAEGVSIKAYDGGKKTEIER